MGLLSKILGKENVEERAGEPDLVYIPDEDEQMDWAIEKAGLTLSYFENSLKNPLPHQQYFSVKIKIVDAEETEFIWLTDPEFDEEGNLFGIIGNEPVNVHTVSLGQQVGVDRSLIADWLIVEEGRLIGGYTIRAIRDNIDPADRKEFDASLGMYVDQGVDHFNLDFDTPEGAILCLEDAFSEKDLQKALCCKNFYQEAKFMLSTLEFEPDEEMIRNTAEVLEASFIQHMDENGMPDFSDLTSAFIKREKITDDHWIITEVCIYPDGGYSEQRLNTYKTTEGWRVMGLAE